MSMSVDTGVSVERVKALEQEVKELTNEIKRLKKCKKYGLVWEDHVEELDKKDVIPLLAKDESLSLPEIADKPMNYLIEGDNYHALRALQHTHRGRIDVIYIDPPYNTGNEFVYNDKIVDREDRFRHSKWLSFMEKRLRLARELMSDGGIIFISIDDNEQAQLKLLCNDIFGEQNFVGTYMWHRSSTPPNVSRKIKKKLEYIHCYEKVKNNKKYQGRQKVSKSTDPITWSQNTVKTLTFPKGTLNVSLKDGLVKKGTYGTKKYPNELLNDLIVKNGTNDNTVSFRSRFVWTQQKLEYELKNKTDMFLSKNLVISYKKNNYDPEVPSNIIDDAVGVSTTEEAGKQLVDIFDGVKVFDYPKPVDLVKYLVSFNGCKTSTVLDFFAGSGTTGHAVMELNKEDGGNRNFILCTNNEVSDERICTYLFEQGLIPKNNKTEFNKYKKNNPEDYQNFIESEEYESLGIARAVTRERLKRVIEGYTTSKGKEVEALPNNLTYLKTQEFDKKEQYGFNRKQLAELAFNSHLLKYPESDYQSIKVDISTDLSKIQHDKSKKLVAFVDVRDRETLVEIADELTSRFGNHIGIETLESYFN